MMVPHTGDERTQPAETTVHPSDTTPGTWAWQCTCGDEQAGYWRALDANRGGHAHEQQCSNGENDCADGAA